MLSVMQVNLRTLKVTNMKQFDDIELETYWNVIIEKSIVMPFNVFDWLDSKVN